MVKINIGTALNVAFTAAVRDNLLQHSETDPRVYLGAARRAVAAAVEHLLRQMTAVKPGTPDPRLGSPPVVGSFGMTGGHPSSTAVGDHR